MYAAAGARVHPHSVEGHAHSGGSFQQGTPQDVQFYITFAQFHAPAIIRGPPLMCTLASRVLVPY